MILVVSGKGDDHAAHLASELRGANHTVQEVALEDHQSPALTLDPDTGELHLQGSEPVEPTALFLRHPDSGEHAMTPPRFFRAASWRSTLLSWAFGQPALRFMNRCSFDRPLYKPHVLARAKAAMLEIPETWVTNDLSRLEALSPEGYIVKPVLGGMECVTLGTALSTAEFRQGASAVPAIVQKRLLGPEYRVYGIGQELFGFRIDVLDSSLVDYRLAKFDHQTKVQVWPSIPAHIQIALRSLMDHYCLDFCAADFKADDSGALFFLDLNEEPMFRDCDILVDKALTNAMIQWLSAAPQPRVNLPPP